ncbi:MAG: hypothetical protein V9G19_06335 [Tetrasphaera sp.]
MDHVVVNPADLEPGVVKLGHSIARFAPVGRGPAIWAAQSSPGTTLAPWAILGVASAGVERLRVSYAGAEEIVSARPLGDSGYVIYLTAPRPGLVDGAEAPILTPVG